MPLDCLAREYLEPPVLAEVAVGATLVWSYGGELRSVRRKEGVYRRRFAPVEQIGRLIEDARTRLGASEKWRPSSWASVWRLTGYDPRPRPTVIAAGPPWVSGAWQEKRGDPRPGEPVLEYDLVSAYAWAGLAGVPDCRFARIVRGRRNSGRDGIYLATIRRARNFPPPPVLRQYDVPLWVTSEEIDHFGLDCRITRGLEYTRKLELRERIEKIAQLADGKKCLRAYWGAWAAETGPDCCVPKSGKTWTLPNIFRDTTRAQFIVSRVRNRLSVVAAAAYHVFVDAVLTRERLKTGGNIGDWVEKRKLENVIIRGAGSWRAEGVEKHAGRRVV